MSPVNDNVRILIEAWKLMVSRLPGSTVQHEAGVASMFGQVPLSFLNISAQDHPLLTVADLRAALTLMRDRAKSCQHRSLIALCEEWLPAGWERTAAEEGYKLALNMTWMTANRLLPPRRPANPILEFRRVSDDATARDLAIINAHAYGMELNLFECICNMQLWLPQNSSYGYVGYVDRRAVTSAATYSVGGTAYVAFVATMPDSHGKGYAEAVMRHAIEQGSASMNLTELTLHASDMGRPLYQSMGFEPGGKTPLLAAETPATH